MNGLKAPRSDTASASNGPEQKTTSGPPRTVIGIDFGGPRSQRDQRKKIVAVVASRTSKCEYSVTATGLNQRLLESPPGWSAGALADELCAVRDSVLVAADFPFSIPTALLEDLGFASAVGQPSVLGTWNAFRDFVAKHLSLDGDVDLRPFEPWRKTEYWLKRSTDVATGAHPPLKSVRPVLFNMTLLGSVFLSKLRSSGRFQVDPFDAQGERQVIEVYPGHAMVQLEVAHYKSNPRAAIASALALLKAHDIALHVDSRVLEVCESYSSSHSSPDHDAADALVACALGIASIHGLVRSFGSPDPNLLGREGAIWSVHASKVGRRKAVLPEVLSSLPAVPASGPGAEAPRAPAARRRRTHNQGTTTPGYVNKNRQEVLGKTGIRGTDHGQWVYRLRCLDCGYEYGANGTDIHLRLCPGHQRGAPGLSLV